MPNYDKLNSENYTEFNVKMIDKWANDETEWAYSKIITPEDFAKAKKGNWSASDYFIVPKKWFLPYIDLSHSRFDGTKILGLASGGGQQMPVLVASGAYCTVMDYSDAQLMREKAVSEREGYAINIVRGDITKRFPFDNNSFDIIYHAVANHFIEDIHPVWKECYRVLKPGGVLIAEMMSPVCYLFDPEDDATDLVVANKLPHNPLKDRELYEKIMSWGDDEGLEFSHSLEEQIGGQLKAGFMLTDIKESEIEGSILSKYYPEFLSTRAVKPKS